jgi:3-oxoacyl-[acyl-carrier protein] reductase
MYSNVLRSDKKKEVKCPRMGRVALVTGSSRGLGREIALRLAEDESVGCVAVHYRSDRKAALEVAGLIRSRGKRSAVIRADLFQEKQCIRLVRTARQRLGPIDILINNFGPFLVKPWEKVTPAEWLRIYRGNFFSAWLCLKAALPEMRARGWGRVVNIGYHRAEQLVAFAGILPYAAAKTSLLLLTRTAAATEAGTGVTVNMVSPGLLHGGRLPAKKAIPQRLVGSYGDVAQAVLYLVSDRAAAVTGTNLVVAGSWKM